MPDIWLFPCCVGKNVSSQELHKYVLGLVGIWILFVVSFPVAYLRVSRSEKYSGSPFKSLTWEQAQISNKVAVVELASNDVVDVVVDPASDVVKEAKTEATEGSAFIDYSKTPAEAESTLGVRSEIASNNALGQLTQQVYKKIDQAWQTWPTFTENLVYQVWTFINSEKCLLADYVIFSHLTFT